uniref:Uncharacterized protein n=1 Tax=Nelumbo nucifera TaxID=4432 RepID=A0A822XKT7_NELNU|nr:TPA_asm: hypothetical protein HUJ06_019621 [Nelumbo nucifera]
MIDYFEACYRRKQNNGNCCASTSYLNQFHFVNNTATTPRSLHMSSF